MFSLTDTSVNDKCKKPNSSDNGTTEFRAGDCVSLSCNGNQHDCSNTDWQFSHNRRTNVELVKGGKVKTEDNKASGRLRVIKQCSLEVKSMGKEDEGVYTCRQYQSSDRYVDHGRYDLKLSKYLFLNRFT